MTDPDLVFERSVTIHATPKTVFSHFTESERFAAWWGEGSSIEPRPGGRLVIRYPNGVVAGGEVVEIEPLERIVFTFGYESGDPIAVGASEVTISLHEVADGTRVDLRHVCDSREIRDAHVLGWRYHLGTFAKVAAELQNADLAALSDRFFDAWAESDAEKRMELLESCTTDDVTFRDLYGCTLNRQELCEHIAAAQVHMLGVITRDGEPEHCHGSALVRWKATIPDGSTGEGANVVTLAGDGRYRTIVGLWCR